MRYVILVCVALGAFSLYLLSRASSNTTAFTQSYTTLLVLNSVLAGCLAILIGYQLWVLRKRLKARVFGAKLTVRLLAMFALMAVIPGTIIYGVSVQFLTRSIESWFDVRVDNALEGGMNLGRSALEDLLHDLTKKGEGMALTLSDQPASSQFALINRLREQIGVEEATLFSSRGTVIGFSSSDSTPGLLPDMPSQDILRQVRRQQPYSSIETIGDKGLYLRVVVPVNVLSLSEDIRALQLLQPVPKRLAQDAESVQDVYRDYQELSYSRHGLKKIFALTLTLALLLALLSAFALAFLLSQKLSAPLSLLAEGTRAVAKGDFTQMQPVKSKDELGMLMQSFNAMTRQLSDSRADVELKQQQLQSAKGYLESILAHLTSGVIAFDERFYVRTVNPLAGFILGVEFDTLKGLKLFEWGDKDASLTEFAKALVEEFQQESVREWEKQIDFGGKNGPQVLLVRGTKLPATIDNGYVVVFDDITHLIQAQRDAAWGEVARRLAHEIKNPLTPIQLSAERIEHKLSGKLDTGDADMLKRATHTIVNQVGALKSMVDAFSEYARSPALNLKPVDLNMLVQELLVLYEQNGVPIKAELGKEVPTVQGDQTLLRQVIHNLLQNAQDALGETASPLITVRTEVENGWVKLGVMDNGAGIPEHLMARVFEPYVTTKQKGTGLGLAISKKIIDEHHGRLQIENLRPHGACVCVKLPQTLEKTT